MIVLPYSGFSVAISVMLAWPTAALAQGSSVVDDVPIIRKNLNDALDRLPDGGTINWHNPVNGHNGTITADQKTENTPDGRACRNFRRTWTFDAGTSRFRGLACKDAIGLWRVQNEQNLGRVAAAPATRSGGGSRVAAQTTTSAESRAASSSPAVDVSAASSATATPAATASAALTPMLAEAPEQPLGTLPTRSVIR